jgi:hypothetical protein
MFEESNAENFESAQSNLSQPASYLNNWASVPAPFCQIFIAGSSCDDNKNTSTGSVTKVLGYFATKSLILQLNPAKIFGIAVTILL